jgi:hypothetical protein
VKAKEYYGIKDARSMRGILARGPARYRGPSKAPRPGSLFNVQKAAQKRVKKFQDMRKFR